MLKTNEQEEQTMIESNNFLEQIFDYANTIPHQIALVDDENEVTYLEMKEKVEETIRLLKKYQLDNQCVALQVTRGVYFPIIVLALTKMSVTFIPQDITQPKERLNQMIETAQATAIISVKDGNYHVQKIDKEKFKSTNAWAIYFTSGSTGIPKAVEIPIENVKNTVIWEKNEFEISMKDRVAAYTPYSFVISYIELFSTLYSGATLYIVNEQIRHDLSLLKEYLVKYSITFMNTTAVIGEQIVKNMKIPSLRILTFSGQRFPKIDLTKLPYKVFNVYGNTECGAATIKEMKYTDKKITIGKPVYRMNALVLGEQNESLAEGEVGELFIYGPQVAMGYYFNSDATSKTFITVESSNNKEKVRGYCTGDFARILPTGEIEYLGRRDRQYKINGVRIDLAEIEEALQKVLPQLQQSYVIVRKNRIYCWITSQKCENEQLVLKKLKQYLPNVMIPTRLIQRESLPLNGNGKTDENLLFDELSEQGNMNVKRHISKKQAAIEAYITTVWAQILNIDEKNITFESDFKKLGASSLQIMELGVKILQDRNQKVNFVELHKQSKLSDMAMLLAEENRFQSIYTFVARTDKMKENPGIFIVHSGNTGSDVYRPLFEKIIEPDFPIYVIEPHNLLTSGERIDGIENIAKYYSELIENFAPEKKFGQIKLMGWSYGGVVASEICHQLMKSKNHKEITELIILDSPFYLNHEDIDLAQTREKNGYYRKYFEETHIFKNRTKKNVTTERLIKNNHDVFQDLIHYKPKKLDIPTIFVRSMVEERPLSDEQIGKLFSNNCIIDVFSRHDYLFVEEKTALIIKKLLQLTPTGGFE